MPVEREMGRASPAGATPSLGAQTSSDVFEPLPVRRLRLLLVDLATGEPKSVALESQDRPLTDLYHFISREFGWSQCVVLDSECANAPAAPTSMPGVAFLPV